MSVARLLLRGVGGSFTGPQIRALASTGFWSDVPDSRAFTYNGVTYFVYVNESGDIYASSYNHASKTTTTPVLIGTGFSSPSGNIHNAVAIIVREPDHKLIVVMVEEGDSKMFIRISTNAEDATAWGAPFAIVSGGNYTYANWCQLAGVVNQPIYLFTREIVSGVFYLGYTVSTDGGSTWSGMTRLLSPVVDAGMYWKIGSDYDTTIHIFSTDNLRTDPNPSSVYHFIFDGTTLYQSDGTTVSGSFPRPVSDGTLVQDDSLGPARAVAWAIDGTGKPAVLIFIYDSLDTWNLVRVGRWTGSAWQVDAVTNTGGVIASNRYVSSGAMNKADPDDIYVPVLDGSFFELYHYTSPDNGTTWGGSAITSGSAADNAMPDTPVNAVPTMRVLWGLGTFTDGTNFDFDVKGFG